MPSANACLPLFPFRLPSLAVGTLMAAAVLGALLAPTALLAALSSEPEPAVAARVVVRDEHEGSRTRCAGCGVVRAIRTIDNGPAAPPTYEFIVRFRDGTVRTTIAADRASWLVGDRIIVVGGGSAP